MTADRVKWTRKPGCVDPTVELKRTYEKDLTGLNIMFKPMLDGKYKS